MKAIILPGYSESNKQWVLSLIKEMDIRHKVLVHEWRHWTSGGFSLNYELGELEKEAGDDEISILAKSVGTSVAMNLLAKGIHVNKLILCGIPFRGFQDERKKLFKDNLTDFPTENVIVFQNSKDPLGNFSVVERFIHSINPEIKVVEKEAGNHHYPYSKDFQEFLSK